MIVKVLQGIPFLCDPVTKTIYAYEKIPTQPLLALGTYDPQNDTFHLLDNWKQLYEPRLVAHRAAGIPRSRIVQPVAPK